MMSHAADDDEESSSSSSSLDKESVQYQEQFRLPPEERLYCSFSCAVKATARWRPVSIRTISTL